MTSHAVENQSTPLQDYNLYAGNQALQEAVAREGAGWAQAGLLAFGARAATAEHLALAREANRALPQLQTHDRFGHRVDQVEFHPAWHALLRFGVAQGLHTSPWADPRPGAHVARAAAYMLWAEVENGSQCPMTMTYGSVPAIAQDAELAATWLPRLLSTTYDARLVPIDQKSGALVGMGMTEKQGGSDVRANTTQATSIGGRDFELAGHKWFMSAPMCDAFLVTAQTDAGVTCFFVPRFRPDGSLNALRLQRLKDKLGNKSNASSEVEFDGAWGRMLGAEGRGIPTILAMGMYTRLDCAIASSGIMRQALAQAIHHCAHRKAFGAALIDQPIMRNVLADMALEVEGAVALSMRLARAYDLAGDWPADSVPTAGQDREREFRRVTTAIAKYWICKRSMALTGEAMETLGGNGYVEEAPLARLYREAPVNSIWEGSGNIMCVDVMRALSRSPGAAAALNDELAAATGRHPAYDRYVQQLGRTLRAPTAAPEQARDTVQRLALALQASLLLRGAPAAVSDTFCSSRLAETGWGACFGTLPAGAPLEALIARARPMQ